LLKLVKENVEQLIGGSQLKTLILTYTKAACTSQLNYHNTVL